MRLINILLIILAITASIVMAGNTTITHDGNKAIDCTNAGYSFCVDFDNGTTMPASIRNPTTACSQAGGELNCPVAGGSSAGNSLTTTYTYLYNTSLWCSEAKFKFDAIGGGYFGISNTGEYGASYNRAIVANSQFAYENDGTNDSYTNITLQTKTYYTWIACLDTVGKQKIANYFYYPNGSLVKPVSYTNQTSLLSSNKYYQLVWVAGSVTRYDYIIAWNGTIIGAPYILGTLNISNTSFSVSNTADLLSNSTAWNTANAYINVSQNLIGFQFSLNTNLANASCMINSSGTQALNYTDMISQYPQSKLPTTQAYTMSTNAVYGNLTPYANYCVYCAYYDGTFAGTSGCLPIMFSDVKGVNVSFYSSNPTDLTSTNGFGQGCAITYNGTDRDSNVSSMQLKYFVNTTLGTGQTCIGNACVPVNFTQAGLFNISNLYTFNLSDNQIYGTANYNLNEIYMEQTPHTVYSTTNNLKVQFTQIKNNMPYNFLEFMANSSSGTEDIYYCNSSYTTGSFTSSANCGLVWSQSASVGYNHTHTQYSKHMLVPFSITNNQIGNIGVSNQSYFVFKNSGSWNYYYLANDTAAMQTTANVGNSWTNFAGTLDSHVHQFDSKTQLCTQINSTDYYLNSNLSAVRCDNEDISRFAPSPPLVYSPSGYSNKIPILINYSNSSVFSPTDTRLVYYQIDLLDNNSNFLAGITNNSLSLNYTMNSSTIPDDYYQVRVTAFDNNTFSSIGSSQIFALDKTSPNCSMLTFTGLEQFSDVFLVSTVSDNLMLEYDNLSVNTDDYFNLLNSSSITLQQPYHINYVAGTVLTATARVSDLAGNSYTCTQAYTVQSTNSGGTNTTESPVSITFGVCPTSASIGLFIFVMVLAFILIVIGFIGAFVIGFFGSLMLFLATFSIFACNMWIGVIMWAVSCLFMLGFILRWIKA